MQDGQRGHVSYSDIGITFIKKEVVFGAAIFSGQGLEKLVCRR